MRVASRSLQGKIKNMEVVDDFESRPRKAVFFRVERDKEVQEVRDLDIPKALPGFSAGTLPDSRKAESGKEGTTRKMDCVETEVGSCRFYHKRLFF